MIIFHYAFFTDIIYLMIFFYRIASGNHLFQSIQPSISACLDFLFFVAYRCDVFADCFSRRKHVLITSVRILQFRHADAIFFFFYFTCLLMPIFFLLTYNFRSPYHNLYYYIYNPCQNLLFIQEIGVINYPRLSVFSLLKKSAFHRLHASILEEVWRVIILNPLFESSVESVIFSTMYSKRAIFSIL